MLAFDDAAGHQATEEEEENYFVSMTDMMVGILFIFIIMLMVFALQFQKQTDTSQMQIEEVLREIDKITKKLDELQKHINVELSNLSHSQIQRKALLQDLESELRAAGLEVQIDLENGVLRLTENAIRFALNDSNLNAQATKNVEKLAMVLARVLPKYSSCRDDGGTPECRVLPAGGAIDTVFIEGHTDSQLSKNAKDDSRNWQLSTERAVATYRAITESQTSLRGLKNAQHKEILSVSGYSSTRPIPGTELLNSDPEGNKVLLEKNRRIDMRFVMQVDPSERLNGVLKLTKDMEGQIEKLREAARIR